MKIPYFVASIIAAVVGASSLASGTPGQGTQNTQFRTTNEYASIAEWEGNVRYTFEASAYDDLNGVRQGYVVIARTNYDPYSDSYISCLGPAYGDVVSVNKITGETSINATLDPASTDCYALNVDSPVTVTLRGQFDGTGHNSQSGTGKITYDGGTSYTKYNYQSDEFSELFTGLGGLASGSFAGSVHTEHRINFTQVK